MGGRCMALKKSSEVITISGEVVESAANTFTQAQIDLQLNPLDLEVFVVTAVDLDIFAPDGVPGTRTNSSGSLSNTSRSSLGSIADSNVIASISNVLASDGFADATAAFEKTSMEAPVGDLPYIAIIATNNFFAQIDGTNNTNAKTMRFRVYGYRAKADAATYAALTQSELLSA